MITFTHVLPTHPLSDKLNQLSFALFPNNLDKITSNHLCCLALSLGLIDVVDEFLKKNIHPEPIPKAYFSVHHQMYLVRNQDKNEKIGVIDLACFFTQNTYLAGKVFKESFSSDQPLAHLTRAQIIHHCKATTSLYNALKNQSTEEDQGDFFAHCLSSVLYVSYVNKSSPRGWAEYEEFIQAVYPEVNKPSSTRLWDTLWLTCQFGHAFASTVPKKRLNQIYTPIPEEESLGVSNFLDMMCIRQLLESLGTPMPLDEKNLARMIREIPASSSKPHVALKVFDPASLALSASCSPKESVLATAIQMGQWGSVECLKKSWNINTTWQDPKTKNTLWHLGANKPSSFKALSKLGPSLIKLSINTPNAQGKTMLHVAARKAHLKILTQAVKWGADRTLKDKKGRVPLDEVKKHAASHEQILPQVIQLLEDDGKISCTDPNALLLTAVKALSLPLVKKYAPHCDIHYVDSQQKGWLSLAITSVRTREAVPERRKALAKILTVLIEAGADVNQQDALGNTPLHHAIQDGESMSVAVLLKAHPDLHLKNQEGYKPSETPTLSLLHPGGFHQALEEILERFIRAGWVLTPKDFRSLRDNPLYLSHMEKQALTQAVLPPDSQEVAGLKTKRKM